jgi:hypothetical protein
MPFNREEMPLESTIALHHIPKAPSKSKERTRGLGLLLAFSYIPFVEAISPCRLDDEALAGKCYFRWRHPAFEKITPSPLGCMLSISA